MTRRARLLPLVVLALATTACADPAAAPAGSSTSAADTGASTSAVGADSPEGASGTAPVDAQPVTAEASPDALVTVVDIRTGRQEGFDRVVLEVAGTGTPGWDVRYVEAASSQGRGDPIEVAGGAVLQVTLTGAGYPYDTGVEEWAGPDPLPGSGTESVTEVAWDATFEGTSVAFVGTTERLPFRVQLLEAPTRVVVDVAHP